MAAIAIGLESKQSPAAIWRQHFLGLSLGNLAAASLAFCLILLIQQMSLGAVAVIQPVVAVFHLTLRSSFGRVEDANLHVTEVNRLYLSTVETLAMAIDAKDDVTHSHVVRVQAYAVGLARALGITDELQLKAIEAAALLHDTGKLGGARTHPQQAGQADGRGVREDEAPRRHRRRHPLARQLPLSGGADRPLPPRELGRHGYPRGVSGEDIPIGARILSVVDCFDALTSDRPYRGRMTEAAALQILGERSGRMY